MPFLEIHAVERTPAQRRQAALAVTDAVVRAFGVVPAAVDIYFLLQPAEFYARGGVLPAPEDQRRTFVKVHAFERGLDRRRDAARLITAALAGSFDIDPDTIAVYFLQQARDEVAHGGVLAVDEAGA